MAGIADDLASVFDEIGTEVELVGSSPVVRERIDFAETDKVGIFAVTLRAGSKLSVGSHIKISASGEHYFIYGGASEQGAYHYPMASDSAYAVFLYGYTLAQKPKNFLVVSGAGYHFSGSACDIH